MIIHFDFKGIFWMNHEKIEFEHGSFSAGVSDENPRDDDPSWIRCAFFYRKGEGGEHYVAFERDADSGVEEIIDDDENRRPVNINRGVRLDEDNFFGTYGEQRIVLDGDEPSEAIMMKVLETFECLRKLKPFSAEIRVTGVSFE